MTWSINCTDTHTKNIYASNTWNAAAEMLDNKNSQGNGHKNSERNTNCQVRAAWANVYKNTKNESKQTQCSVPVSVFTLVFCVCRLDVVFARPAACLSKCPQATESICVHTVLAYVTFMVRTHCLFMWSSSWLEAISLTRSWPIFTPALSLFFVYRWEPLVDTCTESAGMSL